MDLYLSIPLAITVLALVFVPVLVGMSSGVIGYAFAGWHGFFMGLWNVYWRALVGVAVVLTGLWLIYGAGVFLVGVLS